MADNQTAAAPESATSVEVEQQEAGGDASVAKALEHVDSIVGKVTKAVIGGASAPKAKTEKSGEGSGEGEGGAGNGGAETTETKKAMTVEQALAKTGLKGDALKAAVENFEKATGLKRDQPFNSQSAKQGKVKKDAEGGEGGDEQPAAAPAAQGETPLTMATLAEAITKAKAFTPGRIEQLRKAEEILKLLLQGIAPGMSPTTGPPAVESHPNPNTSAVLTTPSSQTSVSKSADGGGTNEIVETLKSLGGIVKGFDERLKAVEKARPAGNSDGSQETTDSKEKVQKSFWNGIL